MTLVETIVTVALTALVLLSLMFLIRFFYQNNAFVIEQSQAVNSARRSIENAMMNLREASYGADGSYPVLAAATSSVSFFADIDQDAAVERARYYLSGSTLYRGVTEPIGNPPSYAGQPEITTLVVDNIRNGAVSLFTYFDAGGSALVDPVDLADITSVRIRVLTDVNPFRAPNVYTLTGTATMRNLYVTDE